MADTQETSYLSIGEVLGLLLEEFPDITISKIRFLESQGLISPERTASGYRKFYDDDVELLRVILTEQRQNYLPLRVIKNRLESGEIDPTGEHLRHETEPDETEPHEASDAPSEPDDIESDETEPDATAPNDIDSEEAGDVPSEALASHPSGRAGQSPDHPSRTTVETPGSADPTAPAALVQGVLLDRAELCGMVGITDAELTELESFGIIAARDTTGIPLYDDDAAEIAKPACEFLRAGIDARHLRNWRTSAEREASLYEQIVTPRFRQRNPEARAQALDELRRLDELGATLRAAMTRHALRHHFEA